MISICMIVKNEEHTLERCLKSVIPYGYEIIVIDTGSSDYTISVARKYTDKVYEFLWDNNFSNARNYSIKKASNDYVLVIDSDEVLIELDQPVLEQMIQSNPNGIGYLEFINEYQRGGELYKSREKLGRLFSRLKYQYTGRIHEQINAISGEKMCFDIPVTLLHTGYDGNLQTLIYKTNRNIELLKQELEDNRSPYVLYQLGKSYYMQGNFNSAKIYFEQVLTYELDSKLQYVQDAVEGYGYSLLETKDYREALQLLNIYDEFASGADFVFLVGLILMNNGYYEDAINKFLEAIQIEDYKVEGVNSYRANYNIGVIYECLGDINKAKEYYICCYKYKKAEERLEYIMN